MINHLELNTRFTYHKPGVFEVPLYEEIRSLAKAFSLRLIEITPESREQSLAITKLEEVVFWANAAIARRS